MSKENSPFKVSFPLITVVSIGLGTLAFNSLRSTTGNFFDTRGVFPDSTSRNKLEQRQNPTNQNKGKITSKQFKQLRDLEMSRPE
jgi:hypothetical protein